VDLVVDHVLELEHVLVADGGALLEGLTGLAVVELGLAVFGEAGLLELALDLVERDAVEDGEATV
jgi:hypothetical protein